MLNKSVTRPFAGGGTMTLPKERVLGDTALYELVFILLFLGSVIILFLGWFLRRRVGSR
jgi:hypothetical protein